MKGIHMERMAMKRRVVNSYYNTNCKGCPFDDTDCPGGAWCTMNKSDD